MELRNIRGFVAAAKALHFSEAARHVHISQAALSRQIQKLEEELGVRLFERIGSGVLLTHAGRTFLNEAVRILEQVDRSVERTQRIGQGIAGTLGIGFVASVTFSLIPALLRQFQTRAPDVRLELKEMGTAEQVAAVQTGALDVGIVRAPLLQKDKLTIRHLQEESIIVVLPAEHRLAEKQELNAEELSAESFVMYPRQLGPGYYDRVVAVCQRAGFSPQVVQEAVQAPTIIGLVAGGLGIALVPASIEPLGAPDVVYRPLSDAKALTELTAIWRADNVNPTLNTFINSLDACALR